MKKCPYCAEEIQDEAIKCRYCFSDLTKPPPTGTSQADAGAAESPRAAPQPAAAEATSGSSEDSGAGWALPMSGAGSSGSSATSEPAQPAAAPAQPAQAQPAPGGVDPAVRYTHSGYRYVLGYGADYFGLWDRQSPAAAVERFPRTDDGWRQAWIRFAGLEPDGVAVPQASSPAAAGGWAGTGTATATSTGGGWTPTHAGTDSDAVQYTHSGTRYLLGYGKAFFGIWDRTAPATPVERFDRNDAGWAAAWRRYTQMETNYTEVGLGGDAGGGSGASSGPTAS